MRRQLFKPENYKKIRNMLKLVKIGLVILLVGGFSISLLVWDDIWSSEAKIINFALNDRSAETIWTWDDWEEIIKMADEGLSKLNLKIGDQEVQLHDTSWGKSKTTDSLNMREIGLALLFFDPTIDHGRGGFRGDLKFAKINQEMEEFVSSRLVDLDSGEEKPVDIRVVPRLSGSRLNGVNNVYKSYNPSGYVILENRLPTYKKIKLRQRSGKRIVTVDQFVKTPEDDFYYSPYSPDLYKSFLVQEGRAYLTGVVDKALEDLRNLEVMSKAYPGKLLADTIKPELLIAIPHIEQSDFGEALVDPKTTFERVDVILGANKQRAYAFTRSSADAQGLNQFTRGTYQGIRKYYPGANLIKDFVKGANDHVNVTKAAASLVDYNRAEYISPLKERVEDLQVKVNNFKKDISKTKNIKSLAKLQKDFDSAKISLQRQKEAIDRIENTSFGMEQDLARYNGKPKWANQALSAYINAGFSGDWLQTSLKEETKEFLMKFRAWRNISQHWQEVYDRN